MSLRLDLLAACLCLVGLAFFYLLISRAQQRNKRLESRLSQAIGREKNVATLDSSPIRLSISGPKRSRMALLAGCFGADLGRTELYPVAWWLVPVIALVPARAIAELLEILIGPVGVFITPVACVMVSRKYFASRHQGRISLLLKQFPDALAMIVRAVRVGIPITEAIGVVAHEAATPTCVEFAKLTDDLAVGSPLDEALRSMAERGRVPEYRFFATALSLQAQTGGGISETLESLADVIRKRIAARARGKALAAEARTSALVLSVLPVIALAGLYLMNPAYIGVLFITSTGHGILAAAALLLGFGTFVMRTMIRMSLS